MKKKDIINLIRYHYDGDETQFRNATNDVAREFDSAGDHQLAEYVLSFITSMNTFSPQAYQFESRYFKPISTDTTAMPLPEAILQDIQGIINAVNHHVGINKFLFEGVPGTGKTESAKQVARLLSRTLYKVDFNELIDSKMGQTAKNIAAVFNDIARMPDPEHAVILFDEIDAVALDRVNSHDVREMGRATSSMLKAMDELNAEVLLIATTNLYQEFDRAFIRRFDGVISFDRYAREDLLVVADALLAEDLKKFKSVGSDKRLFEKIISLMTEIPSPGELKNLIKVSLAFSDPSQPMDYLGRLYRTTQQVKGKLDIVTLKAQGFTLREIEVLTGISKSQVARDLKEVTNE